MDRNLAAALIKLYGLIDMFNFQFMNYPVFNAADILVVCGTIGFAAYYLLLHDKQTAEEAKEPKHGTDTTDGEQ